MQRALKFLWGFTNSFIITGIKLLRISMVMTKRNSYFFIVFSCILTFCCIFLTSPPKITHSSWFFFSVLLSLDSVQFYPYPSGLLHWHWGNLLYLDRLKKIIMTLLNGNIFRVIGHLCGELTSHHWIPLTKASDTELWCFLLSSPEWTVE